MDPGLRTGCKVAVIDPSGKLLDKTVVYPDRTDEVLTVDKVRRRIGLSIKQARR